MRHKTAYVGSGLFLVAMSVGCSSDDSRTSPDGGASDLTCALTAPLSCASMTLCSNSTVKVFHGQLPAAAGGRISVGLYRLGYVLYPDGKGPDASTERADELGFGASDFLHVATDPSALVGGLGSYTTSAASLTLSFTTGCEGNGVPLSAFDDCGAGGSSPMTAFTTTVGYTVANDTISIFRNAPGGWPAMYVYYVVVDENGTGHDACTPVDSAPQAPGDSLQCTAAGFCSCSHHEEIGIDCTSTVSN